MNVTLKYISSNRLPPTAGNPFVNREEWVFEIEEQVVREPMYPDTDEIIIRIVPKILTKRSKAYYTFVDKEIE